MSGNDVPDYGGGSRPSRCDDVDFTTMLGRVDPAQRELIAVGDTLRVEAQDEPVATVVVRSDTGQLGVLTSATRVAQLRDCISRGYKFTAIVDVLDGGNVTVRILSS